MKMLWKYLPCLFRLWFHFLLL